MTAKHVEYWIDALEFKEKGGWKVDTQFVHLMGSGYLLAANEPGVPVDDAVTTVKIDRAGRYRIWVRDRNWFRPHNPGTFSLIVNGEDRGKVLGALPSDHWVWEIAGDYDLPEGEITLALHDLTGYYGRCASILITDDYDFVPPRDVERLHKERARIKGLDSGVKPGGHYDVIVVGGGPGGAPAAIAAARMGAKTLLIHDRPVLGGNGSEEIGISFDGASVRHPYARESGIAEEIRRLRDRDPEGPGAFTRAIEKLAADEKNLTVIFNSHVYDAEMIDEKTIGGVYTMDFITLQKTKYTGRIFMDCTGDAWLGYYAGAKYRYGREAEWQHDEDIAPDAADILTMSGCIRRDHAQYYTYTDYPVEYHAPEWVPKLPETDEEFGRVIKTDGARMYWWLEAPNTYDDMWDGEETRDALFMVILGFYDHVKNYWSGKEKAKYYKFNHASIMNGRRESRRLIGDYILTQDDCTSGRIFEDAVSYTGWALDVHHPMGIYSGKEGPLHCARHVPMPTVPFRCLYSVNIDNLLFAGRNISVTHIALGTVRVQNTIATLGQAAGTAAAMCVKLNELPRGIYERHIKKLQQQLIKDDLFIPGFKNEDEGDPCRTADVIASSVSKTEVFRSKLGRNGPALPLDVPRGLVLGVDSHKGDVDQLWVKLRSDSSEPCPVTLCARYIGGNSDTVAEPGELVTSTVVLPPAHDGWIKFPIFVPVVRNKLVERCNVRVWIEPTEHVSWYSIENLTLYQSAGIRLPDGEWKMEIRKSLHVTPAQPEEVFANCAPENVINGISRIRSDKIYEWVSDPNEALPQWIELKLENPTDINSVSVVFDTDMSNPGTAFGIRIPNVSVCAKEYVVEVFAEGEWVKVGEDTDNFMRKRTHTFEKLNAEKIRVTVFATWGDPSARITEVRAALEK